MERRGPAELGGLTVLEYCPPSRPSSSPEELLERVSGWWDLSGLFPTPRWKVRCPHCLSRAVQLKDLRFTRQRNSLHEPRCDVTFKCTRCSAQVGPFGVPISEELLERHITPDGTTRGFRAKVYRAHEVREALERSSG